MRKADLAYAAGIIDGEGCIGIYVHSRQRVYTKYRLSLSVSNTQEWLCQWLKFAWGGRVRLCQTPASTSNLPLWEWEVINKRAADVLRVLLPYLKIKRPQAEIALGFQNRKHLGHKTETEKVLEEADCLLMKSLKRQQI